eukprot:12502737-Prorocentrum_lima.AAC.1
MCVCAALKNLIIVEPQNGNNGNVECATRPKRGDSPLKRREKHICIEKIPEEGIKRAWGVPVLENGEEVWRGDCRPKVT